MALSPGKRRAFIAVALSLPLWALLAAELLLRFAAPVSPLSAFVDAGRNDDFYDRNKVTIFQADPWLMWRLVPGLKNVLWDFTVVTTNRQGLRMERDVEKKPEGGYRILCVGDSVTFGYRVPLVFPDNPDSYAKDELPYPALLEHRLRAANAGREIEVLNLAVPGYTSGQGRRWLERDLARYQPDLVTLCFGWNDISCKGIADVDALPDAGLEHLMRAIITHSQLATRLSKLGRKVKPPPLAINVPRTTSAQYCANFLAMAELARKQGAQVMIIAPVYRDAVTNRDEAQRMATYRQELVKAARDNRIPCLVIEQLTEKGAPGNYNLFGELIHPNGPGHKIMCDGLLAFLSENALLPADFKTSSASGGTPAAATPAQSRPPAGP